MHLSVNVLGCGEPILMIHGIISDSSFFSAAAELLKSTFEVVIYDRRGYGKSDVINYSDYSVAAQASDAAEVLKKYVNKPAWIFGNSAGGLVAIELCLRFPELVKGLILLEPSLIYDHQSREKMKEWNAELNSYVNSGKIKKALPAFARVIGNETESTSVSTLTEMKAIYKNLSNFMSGELNEVQNYYPSLESVQAIRVPVRVLVTEEGKNSIFAVTSKAGAETVEWKVLPVPGYHNVVKDMPEVFAEKLIEIIGQMDYKR